MLDETDKYLEFILYEVSKLSLTRSYTLDKHTLIYPNEGVYNPLYETKQKSDKLPIVPYICICL